MHTYDLSRDFYKLIRRDTDACRLINRLEEHGDILLFGGAVREYKDNQFSKIPRDIDIVVKNENDLINIENIMSEFRYIKNRFGGYKIKLNNLEFDIWNIENTWAFKEEKIACEEHEYIEKLQDTVFLNVDAIVYNLTKKEMYDEKYQQAMSNRVLDVVLEDNPCIALNIIRAILFKQKYEMIFSEHLKHIFEHFIKNTRNYLDKIYKIQFEHYSREIISKKDISEYILEFESK